MSTQQTKTADEILTEIATKEGELAELSGESLEVWNGREGYIRRRPPGGATVTESWAVSDLSVSRWYPTTEAAKADLAMLARAHGREVSEDGFYVDLTEAGCNPSDAHVTRYED